MSLSEDVSIVEYYSETEGYRCGYCKSSNTSYSHGMWAHSLKVDDYQSLIDRGWRRSGCYCYKPTMQLTCCPMYTIKCAALDFKITKSQKKKLKRFHHFLAHGRKNADSTNDLTHDSSSESGDDVPMDSAAAEFPGMKEKAQRALSSAENTVVSSVDISLKDRFTELDSKEKRTVQATTSSLGSRTNVSYGPVKDEEEQSLKLISRKCPKPGEGFDPNRPLCKKAKLLRMERKKEKLEKLGLSTEVSFKTKPPLATKTIEDHINEPLPDSPAHRIEIKLVSVKSAEMKNTIKISWELYAKYQRVIHNEEPVEYDMSTYKRFLVATPLKPWKPSDGPPQGYGSFHQQYWLDGRLIAVGVIDILPLCVSSVYFFYDPEFHFLVLGTYGALREIAFVRTLHHSAPSLKYYYMGFYIHSCPKMRYKGAFPPSLLLCPEVYSWHPIESCIPKLEKSKYCRFNEDSEAKDTDRVVSISNVAVLFHNRAMLYQSFLSLNTSENISRDVARYAELVGSKLSRRMLMLITNSFT